MAYLAMERKPRRVIGLYSPAPGCGKSHVAEYMVKYRGAVKMSFAEPIKNMVGNVLTSCGVSGDEIWPHLYGSKKKEPVQYVGISTREMMDGFGMFAREQFGADFWLNIFKARLHDSNADLIVIDDLRLPNEWNVCTERWRIERPGVPTPQGLKAEGHLERHRPDHTIINDGTVMQLEDKVLEVLRGE